MSSKKANTKYKWRTFMIYVFDCLICLEQSESVLLLLLTFCLYQVTSVSTTNKCLLEHVTMLYESYFAQNDTPKDFCVNIL